MQPAIGHYRGPGASRQVLQAQDCRVCWIIADLRERVFHRSAVQAQQFLCADSCRRTQLKCPPGSQAETKTFCSRLTRIGGIAQFTRPEINEIATELIRTF